MTTALPTLQQLEITGTDAIAFAQAQFCSDLRELHAGHWQWSAWLSPQGRVRAFFQLLRAGDERLRLILRGGDASELRDALARYVLRSKVALRTLEEARVIGFEDRAELAALGGDVAEGDRIASSALGDVIALPGPKARWLLLTDRAGATMAAAGDENWRLADIRAGLPEVGSALMDELLPQWLGLDRLGAVSVSKGCYPGQEIMSRMHYQGGNKRALYRLELRTDAPPPPGTDLRAHGDGSRAGVIVLAARAAPARVEALASLAETTADMTLKIGSPPVDGIGVAERFT
jgi:tRNA-modifying protein YgfZ